MRNIISDLYHIGPMKDLSITGAALSQLSESLDQFTDINNGSIVALQMPSGIMRNHRKFSGMIRERFHCEVLTLLRPSYGACDIPYPYLEQMGITHLIHLGHNSIDTFEKSIPTLFVPIKLPVDIGIMKNALDGIVKDHSLGGRKIVITTTVQYVDAVAEIARELEKRGVNPLVNTPCGRATSPGQVLGCNFAAAGIRDADAVIFIGTGRFHPRGIAISTGKNVIAVDPHTGRTEIITGEGFLYTRASIALSLSDKKRFSIIICTRPGQYRPELAKELVRKGRNRGYVCELHLLDEIRPEYFTGMKIDGIVSTACPRIAYDDGKLYPVPVITPQEFLLTMGEIDMEQLTIDELE